MKPFSTLRTALTINTFLIAAVPLVVVGFITLHVVENYIENMMSRENMALASSAAIEAEHYLDHLSGHLQYIANTIQAKKVVREERVELFLESKLKSFRFFESIQVVERNGHVLHAAPVLKRGSPMVDPGILELIREVARTGKHVWSSTHVSPETREPSVTLAMPAGDSVVLGTFNLTGLNDIVKRVTEDNGYAYIVNLQGRLIAHPDHSLVEQEHDLTYLPIIKNALEGRYGTFRYVFRGKERQGSITSIPETGWLFAVAQTVDEMYAPIRHIKITLMIGIGITVVLAFVTGIWSLKKLLYPLDLLGRNVQAIAVGNYNIVPPPSGFKELDELSLHVALMADAVNQREEELAITEEELRQQVEEHRKSQDELSITNYLLKAMIDAAPVAIITFDLEGKVTLWNPSAERIFGWTSAEAVGRFIPFVGPEHEEEYKQMRLALAANGSICQRDIRRRRKDGSHVNVRHSSSLLRDSHRNITGIIALYMDITEQKNAEQALRQSEEFFRLIFDQSTIGAAIIDCNYNFRRVNEELCRITGYTKEELLTMNVAAINHPDDFVACANKAESLRNHDISHYRCEKRYQNKDGRIVWVNLSVRMLYDASLNEMVYLSQIEDITDRKRAEEEIRTLNTELERRVCERTAQLEAANRELSSFSYSVSHDLRAPLRHINGFIQALNDECSQDLNDEGRNYLSRVTAAAHRMDLLIDDLLMLSQVAQGELKRVEVDVSKIVREAADELQKSLPERNVEFRIAEKAVVSADPSLVKVMIDNLVGNAWKYSGKKENAIIEFDVIKNGEKEGFYVRDNGAGFDMKNVEKLFTPFQRLHRDSDFEGTGIGLATVARIVRRHGGSIWAEGAVNEGATFYFTLEG